MKKTIVSHVVPVFVALFLVVSCVPYVSASTSGVITIKDYSGENVIYEIEYVSFPCVVYVTEMGISIQHNGSNEVVEEYVFTGTDTYMGFSPYASCSRVTYPVDSYFVMDEPGSLCVVTQEEFVSDRDENQENIGAIEVFTYDGRVQITSLEDVTFPAIVTVTDYGFYATSYGSDVATHFYVFDGLGTYSGVSVLPNETTVRYPVGYTFSMNISDHLYVILETSIRDDEYEDNVSDGMAGAIDGVMDNNGKLDALTPETPNLENELGMDNLALMSVGAIVQAIWNIDGLLPGAIIVASVGAVAYVFFGKRGS